MNDRPGSWVGLSTTRLFGLVPGGGCGTWPVGGVGGLGTLLSPEASAVRQTSSGPRGPAVPCLGVVAAVGVLFVNWIVDASILRQAFL
jgi:hypothetical protein